MSLRCKRKTDHRYWLHEHVIGKTYLIKRQIDVLDTPALEDQANGH